MPQLPKEGTNPRGVEISKEELLRLFFYLNIFIEIFVRSVFSLIRNGLVELSDREDQTGKRPRCSQTCSFIIYMPSELTQNNFVPLPFL